MAIVQKAHPSVKVGKILIQRDERDVNKKAMLYYSKLPECISKCKVLLCDPMLGTGGSSICASEVLLSSGVNEEDIYFVNCVSCPEGIEAYCDKFTKAKVITGVVDECLNEDKFIVPGLGDYGDRYYGTN